jgi:hypothetical protein
VIFSVIVTNSSLVEVKMLVGEKRKFVSCGGVVSEGSEERFSCTGGPVVSAKKTSVPCRVPELEKSYLPAPGSLNSGIVNVPSHAPFRVPPETCVK